MANSADQDQLASSDLHCLQKQDYLGSAGQGLSYTEMMAVLTTRPPGTLYAGKTPGSTN